MVAKALTLAALLSFPEISSPKPSNPAPPVSSRPHRLDAKRIAALETFVRVSMKSLGVPGAAMALLDHGKVVYEGGFGVREEGKPDRVDAHTRFMIGSNTKGMTTLLLSVLVDEGILAWNEPVTRAYPAFQLGDAETTRQVEVRHLICACTGLPREDLRWILTSGRDTPASNTFVLLASTKPTTKFGAVFQYNNLMAAAAGYVGAHLVHPDMELGAAYDSAMREKVFQPMGMNETTFDFEDALAGDHASPHGIDRNGEPAVADMAFNYTPIAYRPAGGAWSTAHDFIKYAANELSLGKGLDGRRVVSPENLLMRRRPGVSLGSDGYYGMGLEGLKIGHVLIVHHGGTIVGYLSDFMAIPDADVGAVILTNANQGYPLVAGFMRRLTEVLYDRKPIAQKQVTDAAAKIRAGALKQAAAVQLPPDPSLVEALAMHYTSPTLGSLDVTREGGILRFDFGAWGSEMGTKGRLAGKPTFTTVDVGIPWADFVAETRDGKRVLVVQEDKIQHVYTETP